jgi:hypothetical protein
MAMHSAIILAKENRQLRAENKRQKKKRVKRRSYIATGGILTRQEGVERSQIASIEPISGVTVQLVRS